MNNSQLTIDTTILKNNLREIVREIPSNCKCVPVLKCDAYGLGMNKIAKVLESTGLIDTFAVAHVSEGIELRKVSEKEIWVLSSPLDFQIEEAIKNQLVLTVARPGVLPLIDSFGCSAKVQLKIETGLNRIGAKPGKELDMLIQEIKASKNIKLIGIFSHFVDQNPVKMEKQFACFKEALTQLEASGISTDSLIKHMGSSSTIEVSDMYYLDAVRIGRRLYMDNPEKSTGKITEVCTYRSFLTAVYNRKKGDKLNYNETYTMEKDSPVGVIGIGYGDGYFTDLFNKHAEVLINGKRAKLLTACMDQSLVLLDGIDAKPGDEVIFFDGKNILSQDTASLIGEEGCSITSNLSPRVERLYL